MSKNVAQVHMVQKLGTGINFRTKEFHKEANCTKTYLTYTLEVTKRMNKKKKSRKRKCSAQETTISSADTKAKAGKTYKSPCGATNNQPLWCSIMCVLTGLVLFCPHTDEVGDAG